MCPAASTVSQLYKMYSVISWESPEALIEVLKTNQVMKVDGKIFYMYKGVQYIGKELSTHGSYLEF